MELCEGTVLYLLVARTAHPQTGKIFVLPGNEIWTIDDPFWQKHKQGDQWGYQCANIIKAIKSAKLAPVIEEYERLRADENYTDVKIDRKSGGLKATHIGHNTDRGKKAQRFFGGRYTSVDLEIECQEQLFKLGHKVILCDESKQIGGNTLPAIDMLVDGILMDIRSITGRGWYSHAMLDKNDQFRRYNMRGDITA